MFLVKLGFSWRVHLPGQGSRTSLRQAIRRDRHTERMSTGRARWQRVGKRETPIADLGKGQREIGGTGNDIESSFRGSVFSSVAAIEALRPFCWVTARQRRADIVEVWISPFVFLQNTKSDQSLLIGKRGLSCSRPAGTGGGIYWRVKFNLWKLFNLIHGTLFYKHALWWS